MAQDHTDRCGHFKATQKLYDTHPQARPENNAPHQRLNQGINGHEQNNYNAEQPPIFTIPTVVHIVHNNGPENLTDAEIIDGIALLNEDFNALNEEIPNEIHPSFQNIVADCQMEFVLACKDPNGNPTTGIVRTVSDYTYAGDDVRMKEDTQWPRDKYMNVWVVNKAFANSNSSGFAYYPSTIDDPTLAVYDGVVIAYWAYGRHNETAVGYEHVLAHEVGHWAELKHTWGDQSAFGTQEACSDDDGVNDTPNTWGHAFGGSCTLETYSCGTLDNNNNFMDYTGTCTGMFTLGQKARMHGALNSSLSDRNNLWTAANLAATIECIDESLVYSNTSIEEDLANNGVVNGTVTVEAQNVTFSQSSGNFIAGTHYTISGLPAGLSATVSVTSSTTLVINVTGTSSPHTNANDVTYSIMFTNAAFNGIPAANVFGSTYNDLQIDFLDPYQIVCIDLDPDPYADAGQAWEYFTLGYGNAEFGTWLYENSNLKLETYSKGAICNPNTRNIQALAYNTYIGSSSTFTPPDPYPDQLDISNPSYTSWNGQTAYIGFEFQRLGRTHYGWLKASVTSNGSRFTVMEGAYNTEPFAGIYAGLCSGGGGGNPSLSYTPTGVTEDSANDGTVSGTISISLQDATLSQTSGSFTAGTHYTISGLPAGLSATVNVLSENSMQLVISGTANNHADVNDTNFSISFLNAAFNGTLATDVQNSTYSLFVDFLDAPALGVTLSTTNPSCSGSSDGAITITSVNGTPPYTSLWSNGATTNSISGLTAGSYSVTITDANGSTGSAAATLTAPANLNLSFTTIAASSETAQDGSVNLTATGGTIPYTYNWSNGSTTQDLSGVGAGTYSVTVTDANGCTKTGSASVVVEETPLIYCDASTDLDYNWITNVSFAQINKSSVWSGGYADYTTEIATVEHGETHTLAVSLEADYWTEITIHTWIDWNRDGDFYDPGEEVYSIQSTGPYSTAVTVPADAAYGDLRMRVRTGYYYAGTPGIDSEPCGTDTYMGEVEDYTIYIAPPPGEDCLTTMDITSDYNNGDIYHEKAMNHITANNVIYSGANIIYDAGLDVLLNAGFEVKVGAEFEARIEGCKQ